MHQKAEGSRTAKVAEKAALEAPGKGQKTVKLSIKTGVKAGRLVGTLGLVRAPAFAQ